MGSSRPKANGGRDPKDCGRAGKRTGSKTGQESNCQGLKAVVMCQAARLQACLPHK